MRDRSMLNTVKRTASGAEPRSATRACVVPSLALIVRRGLALAALIASLSCALAAPGAAADAADGAKIDAAATTLAAGITIPATDQRLYRAFTLPNRIRVLLVSDASADKAAASLVVARGSFDEPADVPGLAHFLEHMLFLGTEKYPEADAYQTFISTNGGSHNAYTAGDHTNYFFDIAPPQFEGALDRFAQFFMAPKFDEAYVAREMNAVNSEYQLQLKQDNWRANAVEKTVLNPAHPAARFTIGSLATLTDQPGRSSREALMQFYASAYAPQDMTLTVYGRESLDALQALVERSFAAVPARPGRPRAQQPPLALPGTLPLRLEFKPEKQQHSLSFSFPLPGLDAVYRENPLEYLTNLLGHEGVGSLHAALKARGWIDSLSAGGGRIDADNSVLNVQMELTSEGAAHEAEIGEALFAYLALLRRDGVDARLYEEQAKLARLAFDFQEPSRALSYVTALSANAERYPLVDVLRGPFALDRFDAALIHAQLARLTPDNVLVTVANPDSDATARERWFDVPYRQSALPPALLQRWREPKLESALALPAPNPFVPTALALLHTATPAGVPTQLPAAPGLVLWHLTDVDFGTPRASLILRLQSELPSASARNSAALALLATLLGDELNAYAYPAALAGLNYDVRQDPRGLLVSVGGYNDKQAVLLQRVLEALTRLRIDPAKFERYREQLIRDWENVRRARPYEQAVGELSVAILSNRYQPEALAAAIKTLTATDLAAFHKQLLEGVQADLLVHGNVDAAGATAIGTLVSASLSLCATCPAAPPQVRKLRAPIAVLREVAQQDDAAIVLYVQGDSRSAALRARYGLLAQMLHGPYFDALRTQQALGYVVGVSPSVFERVPGISFIVQSPVAGVPALLQATTVFLTQWQQGLAQLPAADFEAQKAGLRNRILEQDANLVFRSARLWSDLADGVTSFDTREQIAAALQALTQADFSAFANEFVARAQGTRLLIAVPGKFGGAEGLGAATSTLGDDFIAR